MEPLREDYAQTAPNRDPIEQLRRIVVGNPVLSLKVANILSNRQSQIPDQMIEQMALIDDPEWDRMFTLATSDIKREGSLSKETTKIIETIGVAVGLVGTLLAIFIDIIGLIAAAIISGGAMVPIAVVLIVGLLVAAVLIGLAAVLALIAIWTQDAVIEPVIV